MHPDTTEIVVLVVSMGIAAFSVIVTKRGHPWSALPLLSLYYVVFAVVGYTPLLRATYGALTIDPYYLLGTGVVSAAVSGRFFYIGQREIAYCFAPVSLWIVAAALAFAQSWQAAQWLYVVGMIGFVGALLTAPFLLRSHKPGV